MGGMTTPLMLHGVVDAQTAGRLPVLADMFDKGHVRIVRAGALAGIATACPPDVDVAGVFADPDRAQPLAVAHNRILTAVVADHDVLPVRLGAAFSSEAALQDSLERDHAALSARLAVVAGGVEYGLKLVPALQGAQRNRSVTTSDAPVSGRDYLRRRGTERHAAKDTARDASGLASQTVASLADLALKSRNRPAPAGAQGHGGFAFLVARSRRAVFEAAASALSQSTAGALAVHVTGPWPAYSFAGEA